MKRSILLFAAIALLSCQKGGPEEISNEMKFDFSLEQTKVTSSTFEQGDAISLFAVEYTSEEAPELQIGGNYLNNEKITYNGSAWAGERTLYWSESPCDFYALYPYQKITSIEDQPFSLIADQNSIVENTDITGYEMSDILYAKSEKVSKGENGVISLNFKHMMSKCIVTITKGENFEGEIPDDITTHIYNTITAGTVNLATGSIEKDGFGARRTITMKKVSNTRFEAVIIPQNIERRTPLIEVTMGGIAYLLEYSLSFKPGYVHTINLILNTSPDQEKIEISIDPSIRDFQ